MSKCYISVLIFDILSVLLVLYLLLFVLYLYCYLCYIYLVLKNTEIIVDKLGHVKIFTVQDKFLVGRLTRTHALAFHRVNHKTDKEITVRVVPSPNEFPLVPVMD